MSSTPKKNKSIHKNKKSIRGNAKSRTKPKITDDSVCVFEETVLPARVYFYDEECCCPV
jgi:hypothetical protein